MHLEFDLASPLSNDRVRALFEAIAGVLLGQPVTLERTAHYSLTDENGANACFSSEWKAGPVVLSHCVKTMASNPYDGYPYENELVLRVPGRTLSAYHAGSGPLFTSLRIRLEGCTELELKTVSALLRRELGGPVG